MTGDHADMPPRATQYVVEDFDTYRLAGRVLFGAHSRTDPTHLLAIHGARSDYSKLDPLLYALQALGVGSLSFNLSGHNTASAVPLENTSLGANLHEALRFAARLTESLTTVIGHSMGGALALKVAEAHRATIRTIVLVCPAIYPDTAYPLCFGQPFKDAISTPFGFLRSSSLRFLREYEGNLLLVMGEYDGLKSTDYFGTKGKSAGWVRIQPPLADSRRVNSVIPHEVVSAIEGSIRPQHFSKIILPDCDHAVSDWLRTHTAQAEILATTIATLMSSARPAAPPPPHTGAETRESR